MAVNKIPESQLPVRSVSDTDYVRIVGADGKSYRVPKTDFNGGGGGLTQDTKQALLQCFAHTAWTDAHGQDYYDDLEDALYPFDLLSSITAVYTQSGTVYDTDSLDDLKADLVVTGNYSDGTYNQTTKYTLSGTLTVGTSTITVTYGGKTATFTVTVTQSAAVLTSISAVYTQSGTVYTTDSLDSLKTDLVVTAHYSDSSTVTVASTDYTLSGTLTVGTSTITVTYEGETDTFSVTVSAGYWMVLSVEDDFLGGYGNNDGYGSTGYPYTVANTSRTSYYLFDILVSSGYKYKFEYNGTGIGLGVPSYSTGVFEAVENHQSVSSYKTDTGWKSSGYEFTPTSNTVCIRLTFDKAKANLISAGCTEVRITRTPV